MADAQPRPTGKPMPTDIRVHYTHPTFFGFGLNASIQPTVSFGASFQDVCMDHITSQNPPAKAFLLVDSRLHPSRRTRQAQVFLASIEAMGASCVGATYMPNNLSWADTIHIIKAIRASSADTLIVVGNDAFIDFAKVIVYGHSQLREDTAEHLNKLLTPSQTDVNSVQFVRQEPPFRTPLVFICVPTDGGKSPYSFRAFGVNPVTSAKSVLVRHANYPRLVILDPTMTVASPRSEWISKAVEAINHAVEGLVSTNAHAQVSSMLRTAIEHLCTGLLEGENDQNTIQWKMKARLLVLMGANMASATEASSPEVFFGISHAVCNVAHDMGNIKHSLTAAVVLPTVLDWTLTKFLEFHGKETFDKVLVLHQSIAHQLWESPVCALTFSKNGLHKGAYLSRLLRTIFNTLGLPSNLRQLGFNDQSLGVLAERLIRQHISKTAPMPLLDMELALNFISFVAPPLPDFEDPFQGGAVRPAVPPGYQPGQRPPPHMLLQQ
ncbi:hypothetical protein HDK64DRAFT_299828 [Phyllosticta capitalensis]